MLTKSNMYEWITTTRNYLAGECPHRCTYCYVDSLKERFPVMNKKYTGKPRLIKKELRKHEGSEKTIFVQSCGDLFAEKIPSGWITQILAHCNKYPDNEYLFQSKNPGRFREFISEFPPNTIFGTTIETNYSVINNVRYSLAPTPTTRANDMAALDGRKMVTIEPIMVFHLDLLIELIEKIQPEWVNIGADSKGHNSPEPSADKIRALIAHLRKFTQVKLKNNLGRLLK